MTKVRATRDSNLCPPLPHALALQPSTRRPLSRASSFAAATPPWTTGPEASAFRSWLQGVRGGQQPVQQRKPND
jgi:hypothetical protein